MRLVVDTNTALSGLLWPGGPPGALIDHAVAGHIELLSSPALLAELRDVLGRRKFIKRLASRNISVDDLFDGYASLIRLVKPTAIPRVIKRDPDDDHVIACAVTGRAEIIVSGDQDVLELVNVKVVQVRSVPVASFAPSPMFGEGRGRVREHGFFQLSCGGGAVSPPHES